MKWKGKEVTKVVCTHARGVFARSYDEGKQPLVPGETYVIGKDIDEADARYLMAMERAAPALPVPSGEKSDDEVLSGGKKK